MGADAWTYYVAYESDVRAAMKKAQERVFQAGEYRGSEVRPSSIQDAVAATEPEGTGSILDMMGISDAPDYGTISRISAERLKELYGTDRPTRKMVEEDMRFFEDIDRGQGVYIVLWERDEPTEILFAGCSFD